MIDAIERATLETLEELLSMHTAGLKQRDEANTVATLGKVVVAIGLADGTKMSKHLTEKRSSAVAPARVPGCRGTARTRGSTTP